MNSLKEPDWYVYMLRRDDNAIYTGISLDVQRRLKQHLMGKGAKALRGRSIELVYRVAVGNKSLALRVELRVKALNKARKEDLLLEQPERAQLLELVGLEDTAVRVS